MTLTATDWIATYAALVSTVVFWWQLKQSRPQVKVVVLLGFERDGVGAFISIQNLSTHPLNLAGIAVLYPWAEVGLKRRIRDAITYRRWDRHPGWVTTFLSHYGHEVDLPNSVGPYDSCSVFIPEHILWELFKDASEHKIVVKVQDAVARDHYSNEFRYDVAKPVRTAAVEPADQSSD